MIGNRMRSIIIKHSYCALHDTLIGLRSILLTMLLLFGQRKEVSEAKPTGGRSVVVLINVLHQTFSQCVMLNTNYGWALKAPDHNQYTGWTLVDYTYHVTIDYSTQGSW